MTALAQIAAALSREERPVRCQWSDPPYLRAEAGLIAPAVRERGMTEDERVWAIKDLLLDYVKSPSLRHMRDPAFAVQAGAGHRASARSRQSAVGEMGWTTRDPAAVSDRLLDTPGGLTRLPQSHARPKAHDDGCCRTPKGIRA